MPSFMSMDSDALGSFADAVVSELVDLVADDYLREATDMIVDKCEDMIAEKMANMAADKLLQESYDRIVQKAARKIIQKVKANDNVADRDKDAAHQEVETGHGPQQAQQTPASPTASRKRPSPVPVSNEMPQRKKSKTNSAIREQG